MNIFAIVVGVLFAVLVAVIFASNIWIELTREKRRQRRIEQSKSRCGNQIQR